MNISNTKQELIEWINGVKDAGILERIKFLKDQPEDQDWWNDLEDAEAQSIKSGLKDLDEGRTHSHEEAKKIYGKWL